MGYTDLLNEPNVYISYNGNDTGVINNAGGGSLALVRTPLGATATFATDNPYSEFGSCLVTQNQWTQSWTGTGNVPPGNLSSVMNTRWNQQQATSARAWEFWIKIESSVNLTMDSILLEWVESNETTRLVLGTDRRLMLTGPLIYTTYQGVGQQSTVYSDPLSLDEWHLVSITAQNIYAPPGFYDSSFETRACSYLMVDGRIYRHSALTNDASIKSNLRMPNDLFYSISVPGIKIAHFAFWDTSVTHKQHVRRYMYGKAKSTQQSLVLNSNPWAYSFMDYSQENNNYPLLGTYVPIGNPLSAINPSPETVTNGAADFNYHGGIEGTTCIKMTKYQSDPTLITGAGNFLINSNTPPNNFADNWQDNALNTGNWSIEFWYKNGFTQRDYDSTANGVSPIMLMIVNGSVVQNLRLTNTGEIECVVKLNNAASSQSTGTSPSQWTMRDLSKRIDNEWHHIAIVSTYNNPVLNVKTYVDGALYHNYQNNNCQVLNSSYQVNPSDPNQHLIAFFYGAAQQYQTNGHLDNLAFYTRQLTEEEIRSRYLNYNIVEKPHIKGAKQRKFFAANFVESTTNVWQPADITLYHNGTTFVKNTNEMKYYDGTQWVNL